MKLLLNVFGFVVTLIVFSLISLRVSASILIGVLLLVSFILHEVGHSLAMILSGVRVESVIISPFLFAVKPSNNLLEKSTAVKIMIYLSGPAVNFCLMFVFLFLCLSLNDLDMLALAGLNCIFLSFNMLVLPFFDGGEVYWFLTDTPGKNPMNLLFILISVAVTAWAGFLSVYSLAFKFTIANTVLLIIMGLVALLSDAEKENMGKFANALAVIAFIVIQEGSLIFMAFFERYFLG